jgi:hypothetical protein
VRFHENPLSGSEVVMCSQAVGEADRHEFATLLEVCKKDNSEDQLVGKNSTGI